VELTILGAHGTWPGEGGATSGLLIRDDGFNLWVDAGTGTLANLQRHIGLYDVGAIVISHSHPDHLTDIYAYLYARLYGPQRQQKIPLLVAPGVLERAQPLVTDDATDLGLGDGFDLLVVEPGTEQRVGPFRIATAPMSHSVPTIGMRVESGGSVLAYTADTGPTAELDDLTRAADVLVAEASWQGERGDQPAIHLTAREAGEVAAKAGAGRLVLTHIRPHLDSDRSREEAASAFDGRVEAGKDNATMRVRS
jgi:ribonuclease BN (tRNA processing enzyme)